jgi:ABC-type multidrug transport system ATPase subunit
MNTIAEVRELVKNYRGIRALKGVSFRVPVGSVFGILGPNGSGKTTLLGILTNVLKATAGSFTLFDESPTDEHRRRIGCLLETPNFYPYLGAVENLEIIAAIRGYGSADIARVIEMVNLTARKDSPFSTYSLGMKQRLAIAAALLGEPDVLILDEPTNGLDPVGIAEIRSLIHELAKSGKTVIMASHLLDEVEKVCTHVAILKSGELISSGPVDSILQQDVIIDACSSDLDLLESVLQHYPGLTKLVKKDKMLELTLSDPSADTARLNRFCFDQGIVLSHLTMKKVSLEEKFLILTRSSNT